MKKLFVSIALCFIAMFGLNAQTVNPDFQDGFLYVKLYFICLVVNRSVKYNLLKEI